MRPLFTLHAGEYLVGEVVEKEFPDCQVWIPATDTGIDLLVTNPTKRTFVGLQVNFSKDFYSKEDPFFEQKLESFGWWNLKEEKIQQSKADFWVFVLYNFNSRKARYLVIPTQILLKKLLSIHGDNSDFKIYLMLTATGKCWEVRGLQKTEQRDFARGHTGDQARDFSQFIDAWDQVRRIVT